MDILIVYCTFPAGEEAGLAAEIAQTVVEEGLAACVSLIPQVRSFYRWEGELYADPEQLAIIKTTAERFEALRERIVEMHPYDCPEVVAVPISHGHPAYLSWVRDETETD
jgi:periplasmic divalent cation tolerance protein